MLNIFKEIIDTTLQLSQMNLNDIEPDTVQRIKEEAFLTKFISETQVAAHKCGYYANIAKDKEIADLFKKEAEKLSRTEDTLQKFYNKMKGSK